MRINKYLSSCGLCSRREADKLIKEGRVTVNGKTAIEGMDIQGDEEIIVGKKKVHSLNEKVYLKFYKPRGIVCTAEKREKNNLTDYLKYPVRLTYAGRLDKESEGLLLLTNDGDLIDRLMRARNAHEKEYLVTTDKAVSEDMLNRMREGIYLKELDTVTRPCQIEKTGKNSFRIILTQGLNRQIRRMCKACQLNVTHLKRVRVANILLGNLKVGSYEPLSQEELKKLMDLVGGE